MGLNSFQGFPEGCDRRTVSYLGRELRHSGDVKEFKFRATASCVSGGGVGVN